MAKTSETNRRYGGSQDQDCSTLTGLFLSEKLLARTVAVFDRFFELRVRQLLRLHLIDCAVDCRLRILGAILLGIFWFCAVPPEFGFQIGSAFANRALIVALLCRNTEGEKNAENQKYAFHFFPQLEIERISLDSSIFSSEEIKDTKSLIY